MLFRSSTTATNCYNALTKRRICSLSNIAIASHHQVLINNNKREKCSFKSSAMMMYNTSFLHPFTDALFQLPQQQQQQVRLYAQKKGGKDNKKGGKGNNDEEAEGEAVIDFDRKDFESKMNKHVEIYKSELSNVRTGRANPQLLENIKVKLDDGSTPLLKSLGAIVVKNARLLSVNVFDQKNVMLIMKAIREEDLGFNPQAKANIIDVPVPKMTMEIRESVVKMMKRNAEEKKERIRLVRRDGMNTIKKIKNAPKDDVFRLEKEMQTITDSYIKKIDDLLMAKEKEILQNSQ